MQSFSNVGYVYICKNGATASTDVHWAKSSCCVNNLSDGHWNGSAVIQMDASDYIEVYILQIHGSARNCGSATVDQANTMEIYEL